MSYTLPTQCSWYKSCVQKNDCKKTGTCVTVPVTAGPNGNSHKLHTNYTVSIGGVVIPMVVTKRDFSVSYGENFKDLSPPTGYITSEDGYLPLYCYEREGPEHYCTVLEDCTIEKSTLHYVDQRYGVCLYRYQKDYLLFDISSTEMTSFKGPWGQIPAHKVKIKTTNFTCNRTEEWRLIIDGADTVLATHTADLSPFSEIAGGGSTFDPKYKPDPTIRQILVFPQPPSLGIPWEDDIKYYGFYDYGNDPGDESALNRDDGGNKDMYYPLWCRNLQQDPFWRAAADKRYQIDWWHEAFAAPSSSYTPPAITVDPIPRGTFVRHPVVGDVYQFLVNEAYGATIATSPDFNTLIDNQLALAKKDLKTHDTTLYYPIGVA